METVWLLYDKDENGCEVFLMGRNTLDEAEKMKPFLTLLGYNVTIHEAVVWTDASTIE